MIINYSDFPSFHHDVKDFSTFEKANAEIGKIVKDTVSQIDNPAFKVNKKFRWWNMNLERIFESLWKAQDGNRLIPLMQQEYPLDRKCVKNLYRLLWDEELVAFFVLWISSWVITLESTSWSQVFIELEAKFLWINQVEMAQLIRDFWWVERYKALLADDYFTFWNNSDELEKDGKRQIRVRERHKDEGGIQYSLTLKRKPSTKGEEYRALIQKYAATMEEEIDVDQLKNKMKALLEQEFNIHDNMVFRDILGHANLYMSRSKLKLRRSTRFKWGKVEDDNYYWVPGIPPFAELESPSEEILDMMIELLNLSDKKPLITWSEWVFKEYWVQNDYLKYSQQDPIHNNIIMQRRNAILNRWLTIMGEDYFRKYVDFN